MNSNILRIHAGKLEPPRVGQWIETSYEIDSPGSFGFEAKFCRRKAPDSYCEYYFGTPVRQPFEAGLALALHQIAAAPPFEPTCSKTEFIRPDDDQLPVSEVKRLQDMLSCNVSSLSPVPAEVRSELSQSRERVTWYLRMAAYGAFGS